MPRPLRPPRRGWPYRLRLYIRRGRTIAGQQRAPIYPFHEPATDTARVSSPSALTRSFARGAAGSPLIERWRRIGERHDPAQQILAVKLRAKSPDAATASIAALAAAVLLYAFIVGLLPVIADDVFWMLATARWILDHGEVPWVDVFSYTAAGQPWIYPVGGSFLFYGVWLIGGYVALSYAGAVACAATTALVLRKASVVSAILATLALPAIADRCFVRADLFTTILTAAFLALLWRYHCTGRGRLWLLPGLMVLWVNAHLGFFVGFGAAGCLCWGQALGLHKRPGELQLAEEAFKRSGRRRADLVFDLVSLPLDLVGLAIERLAPRCFARCRDFGHAGAPLRPSGLDDVLFEPGSLFRLIQAIPARA
jgi:hypothetical protein